MQQRPSIRCPRAAGVAFAAMALVVATLGLTGSPGGAATASRSDDLAAIKAAQQLLQYVPSDHRASCSRQVPATFADGNFEDAVAIVKCEHPADAVDSLIYVQYATAAQMATEYTSIVPDGLPASDGTATACPVEATWRYGQGADAGSDACFVATNDNGENVAKMVWTADAPLILGYAFNLDGDSAGIKQWWNDNAGPLASAEADPGLADLTPAGRKSAGRALIQQAPKALTKCTQRDTDPTVYLDDDAEWAWLPWLSAEVTCKGPGKGTVYYAQVTPDNAEAFWNAFHDTLTDEDYGPKHPAVCKDPQPLVSKGDDVGAVVCWYYHQALWAAWYDKTTGIVGGATVPTSPQGILDYVKHNQLT